VLPDDFILSSIDQLVGNTPVDPAYEQVTHHRKWVIPWMEDDPGLTVAQLWVNRTLEHGLDAFKCELVRPDTQPDGAEGLMGIHWRTAVTSPQISAMGKFHWNTDYTSKQFWFEIRNKTHTIRNEWAVAQFGANVAPKLAAIFVSIESFNLPR
jgi:hypothetical protein